jgi:prolyl-tRNA synthetase
VKFKDAELIGNPYIIIVGKGLQEGKVEFRVRKTGEKSELPIGEIVAHVMKITG